MAGKRGSRKKDAPESAPEAQAKPEASEPREPAGRLPVLPEIARRALSIGLSGCTRKEFLERLSFEIAQTLEKVDIAATLRELLEGRTLEVHAEIRLGDREGKPASQKFDVGIKRSEEDT